MISATRVAKLIGLAAAVLAAIACWVEVARLSLLKRFSIDHDREYILPTLRAALTISATSATL